MKTFVKLVIFLVFCVPFLGFGQKRIPCDQVIGVGYYKKTCYFHKLPPSPNSLPFYCNVHKSKFTLHISNHHANIQGFSTSGKINMDPAKLNEYYFLAQEDPHRPYKFGDSGIKFGMYFDKHVIEEIECYEGSRGKEYGEGLPFRSTPNKK